MPCAKTTEISFELPDAAIEANDDSGPTLGIYNVENGIPTSLVTKDTWYRATMKRQSGFSWEGKYSVAEPGKYVMLLVPKDGSVLDAIGMIDVVAESSSRDDDEEEEFPITDDWINSIFGSNCQVKTKFGIRSVHEVLQAKKIVGIYFSAKWCGPCRMFTPILSEFYSGRKKGLGAQWSGMEIIYCSLDQDEEQFEDYYSKMPWTALRQNSDEVKFVRESICKSHGVCISGIPAFIVLDGITGKLLTSEGRSFVDLDNGSEMVQKWIEQAKTL